MAKQVEPPSGASTRLADLLGTALEALLQHAAETAKGSLPVWDSVQPHVERACEALHALLKLVPTFQPRASSAAASERSQQFVGAAVAMLTLTEAMLDAVDDVAKAAAQAAVAGGPHEAATAAAAVAEAAAAAARRLARPLAALVSALAACIGALQAALCGAPDIVLLPACEAMAELVQHHMMQAALQVSPPQEGVLHKCL